MAAPRYAFRLGWRSIRRVCPHLTETQARLVADALGPAFHKYSITTRRRAAMAVAQMAHESAGFRTTTEYASGAAYDISEDRKLARRLGNTQPGDGPRFKGRGYIQITGRSNYRAVSAALGHDFIRHPKDLAEPKWAAKASCYWWMNADCNEIADSGDFIRLTLRINGGTNGLADRQSYYRRARLVAPFLIPKRRRP